MIEADHLKPRVVIVTGPTGSGKSAIVERLHLERRIPAFEIVIADSRQIYSGMSIGTDKPTVAQQELIPHHLLDIATPDRPFSAGEYLTHADRVIHSICRRGKLSMIVGGTGLYIRALIGGLAPVPANETDFRDRVRDEIRSLGLEAVYRRLELIDPERAARIQPHDERRIIRALEIIRMSGKKASEIYRNHRFEHSRYEPLMFVLSVPREKLYSRIDRRVDEMIRNGWIDEVRNLTEKYGRDAVGFDAIGYREIRDCLYGDLERDEAIRLIKQGTRRYAKRQLTWFRREPHAIWIEHDPEAPYPSLDRIEQSINLFLRDRIDTGQATRQLH